MVRCPETTPRSGWSIRWGWLLALLVTLLAVLSVGQVGSSLQKILERFRATALPDPTLSRLLELAGDPNQRHLQWNGDGRIRNAHHTNTAAEMKAALMGPYNFLEGDILMAGTAGLGFEATHRVPVMWHDPLSARGMLLSEWLRVGAVSKRGLKLDIKHSGAVQPVIEEVKRAMERYDLREERLMFNADVVYGPGGTRLDASLVRFGIRSLCGSFAERPLQPEDLQRLRESFPAATISVGAMTAPVSGTTRYTASQLQTLIDTAQDLGGSVSFPLRAEFVDADVVRTLRPHGQIAVWNHPSSFSPPDLRAAIRAFRALGVDGAVDLRR